VGVIATGVRRDELADDVQAVVWGILDNEEAVEGEGEVDKES
jgi:hypothetical protein